jgi:hypothetical protein
MTASGPWIEKIAFVAGTPARVAVLVGLVQSGQATDELSLAQMAGLLLQQMGGQPLETAVLLAHITDLAGQGLLERDPSGFRWRLTDTGRLVIRQLMPVDSDPPGSDPLDAEDIRAWRDRLLTQLEEEAGIASQAGYSTRDLLPGQATRLAELRVLNRILAEEKFPSWLTEGGTTSPQPLSSEERGIYLTAAHVLE